MSDLLVAHTPRNYRDDFGEQVVEGDTYMICDKMRELSPNLIMRRRKTFEGATKYTVSEMCEDGQERWVMQRDHLDERIIRDLQYMLHVPYEHRYAEAERIADEAEAEYKENEKEQLFETMGGQMLIDLHNCGFIDRPSLLPKRGVYGGRGSKYKS